MTAQNAAEVTERLESSAQRLMTVLLELRRRVPEVTGSAIADKSGLPMACDLPPRVNSMMVTAMSALAMQSCANIMTNLGLEPAERITTESSGSVIVVRSLSGGNASLFAVMTGSVDPAQAKREMDAAAREAEGILGG